MTLLHFDESRTGERGCGSFEQLRRTRLSPP